MKISDVRIYDFEESVVESGLPKSNDPTFNISRAKTLGNAKIGSGHDCFLKGILVRFRLTADHCFWVQFMRYHFADIVSSESKMHCLTKLKPKYHKFVSKSSKKQVEKLIDIYNNWHDKTNESIHIPQYNIDMYNNWKDKIIRNNEFLTNEFTHIPQSTSEMFEAIVMNCPIGLELEAGITTNFLQLKSMYYQRKNHKMSSWKDFCNWVKDINNQYKGIILKQNLQE
ncbi:MAG: hypothetical protein ACOC2U_00590 [bacterium]